MGSYKWGYNYRGCIPISHVRGLITLLTADDKNPALSVVRNIP